MTHDNTSNGNDHKASASDPIDTPAHDDWRITAYALGELDGGEASAFEALLADDPALQAEVDAVRGLGTELQVALSVAASDTAQDEALNPEQRAQVLSEDGPTGASVTATASGRRNWPVLAMAAAACVLLGVPILLLVVNGGPFGGGGRGSNAPLSKHVAENGPTLVDGYSPHLAEEPGEQDMGEPLTDNDLPMEEAFPLLGGADGEAVGPDTSNRLFKRNGQGSGGAPQTPGRAPVTVPAADPWSSASSGGGGAGHAQPGGQERKKSGPTMGAPTPSTPAGVAPGATTGEAAGIGSPPPTPSPFSLPRATLKVDKRKKGGRGLLNLEDVTNGLEDSASAGRDNAGAGIPAAKALNPKAVFGDRPAYGYAYNRQGVWVRWNTTQHGEHYVHPGIDGFMRVGKRGGHTSTFSVDVDTASYTNVRRILNAGQRPHPAAVRLEEFINYFDYAYAAPAEDSKSPFATHMQVAACPWNPRHRLARIALQGKRFSAETRPASNLVFLIDVSGSMENEDKLPLLKSGLAMLTENLDARDRVSIVTYSSSATRLLESTSGDQKDTILGAIRSLKAGGSTNGAAGIQLAYAEAKKGFRKDGANRVILCTDGDFNVGVSDGGGLVKLVTNQAKGGVFLSVLGFGTGNLQDAKMEAYSNAGNGMYAYVDSLEEAKRVLVEQMQGTLIAIAKDVKFQVWFNPKTVTGWRLLGYENRRLAARDFNNDKKDAGDIGAGHQVTALYEIIPTGVTLPNQVDPNPFVNSAARQAAAKKAREAKGEAAVKDDGPAPQDDALFIWRLRWKQPDGKTSELLEQNVFDKGLTFENADRDFQWASAVTAYGMLLRHSPHRGQASWDLVQELAKPAQGEDPHGRRAEFLGLVEKAQGLGK